MGVWHSDCHGPHGKYLGTLNKHSSSRTATDARSAGAIVEQFREEGYAVVRGFVDTDEIPRLQAETARIYAQGLGHHATFRHGNLAFEILPERYFGRRYLIQAYWFAWISPYFEAFRRRPAFFRVLEPLLGRNIKQVAQQIHWKPPGARQTGYRFHQDLRFRERPEVYDDVVSCTVNTGLAIDPASRENGCLQIIPGSHKRGYLGLSDQGDGQIMKGETNDEELRAAGLDPTDVVHVELNPGDLALWSLLTVHGSSPNTSNRDRALAISSYVRAEQSERGEWAFRDGVSTPLGDTPQLCKNEKLLENPNPYYDETPWWL